MESILSEESREERKETAKYVLMQKKKTGLQLHMNVKYVRLVFVLLTVSSYITPLKNTNKFYLPLFDIYLY